MKKVWILAAAAMLLVAAAGCGNDVQTDSQGNVVSAVSSSTTSEVQTESTQPSGDATSYDNTLEGLASYMKDLGYIEKDYTAPSTLGLTASNSNIMQAQIIGAVSGKRYTGSYDGSDNVTIELYEYDPANLDETGEKVLQQIKEKGTFTVFDTDVEAYLSSNSKYVMVYKDTELSTNTNKESEKYLDHDARRKEAVEKFQAFHA